MVRISIGWRGRSTFHFLWSDDNFCDKKTNEAVYEKDRRHCCVIPVSGWRKYESDRGICCGNRYTAKKKFRGILTKRISGLSVHVASGVYEDEKGWLHIKTGAIANLRELAEQLWPIGSKMTVYYNPDHPKRCYVDRPVLGSTIAAVFIVTGLIILILSVLLFVLIQL